MTLEPSVCRLCLQSGELRISHFMPAGVYPKNKKLQMATRSRAQVDPAQVVDRLLCGDCEHRFNRNGEDEVLRWLGPKTKKRTSPLWTALQTATPVFRDSDLALYFASAFGISAERFAYFVLSLVWRAAAHEWPLPDGTRSTRLDLGEYYEPVRQYLLDPAGFPKHTYLTMALCTDDKPQDYWMAPQHSEEVPGLIVVLLFGALFRVWFGREIPKPIERQLFYPDQNNRIFTTHCWDVLHPSFQQLFPPEST